MALIGTLNSGVSALRAYSTALDVVGNNIANVNTTAYKSRSTSFADTLGYTIQVASATDSTVQLGCDVKVSGISTNYSQGSLTTTGTATDLGISGEGYFIVQDGSGNQYATRDGSFHFDASGNLVNSSGYSVLDTTGAAITVSSYSSMASVSIGSDGSITAVDSSGNSTTVATVGLMKFDDQTKLEKSGDNLYTFSSTGKVTTTDMGTPSTTGYGSLQTGTLEASNVDLTEQFSELITTQRSFQAGSRLVTVSDTILDDVLNMKR